MEMSLQILPLCIGKSQSQGKLKLICDIFKLSGFYLSFVKISCNLVSYFITTKDCNFIIL